MSRDYWQRAFDGLYDKFCDQGMEPAEAAERAEAQGMDRCLMTGRMTFTEGDVRTPGRQSRGTSESGLRGVARGCRRKSAKNCR